MTASFGDRLRFYSAPGLAVDRGRRFPGRFAAGFAFGTLSPVLRRRASSVRRHTAAQLSPQRSALLASVAVIGAILFVTNRRKRRFPLFSRRQIQFSLTAQSFSTQKIRIQSCIVSIVHYSAHQLQAPPRKKPKFPTRTKSARRRKPNFSARKPPRAGSHIPPHSCTASQYSPAPRAEIQYFPAPRAV